MAPFFVDKTEKTIRFVGHFQKFKSLFSHNQTSATSIRKNTYKHEINSLLKRKKPIALTLTDLTFPLK